MRMEAGILGAYCAAADFLYRCSQADAFDAESTLKC